MMLLSQKHGAGMGSRPPLPAIAACSRAEGDAQDTVPVAAHPTGKKVCSQVTLLCVHTGAPLQ